MKKLIQIIVIILVMVLSNSTANAQASVLGNSGAAANFVGWDITATNPALSIKHELALPINFYTNGGNGTYNNQRMIIFDGSGSPSNAGFVGIGTNFTAPVSLLHLHDPASSPSLAVYHQWTNSATGATASDGLRIGIDLNGVAELRQQENLAMDFFTNNNLHDRIDVNGNFTIGLTNANNYFGITANTPVLWHNGTPSRIYVGVNAGNATSGGTNNTFVGNQTAPNIGAAGDNTLVGFQAVA